MTLCFTVENDYWETCQLGKLQVQSMQGVCGYGCVVHVIGYCPTEADKPGEM